MLARTTAHVLEVNRPMDCRRNSNPAGALSTEERVAHREEYITNVFSCDRVATLIGGFIKLVMSVSVVTCGSFKTRESLVVSSL